jgi:hypothetical protein
MTQLDPVWQFLFILIVPLVVVAGAVVTLYAIGALFLVLENPGAFTERIEAAFRRPLKPPRMAGKDHYYRPYWAR